MVRTQDKEAGIREMNELLEANRAQEFEARAQELNAEKNNVYGELLQMVETKIIETVDQKVERRFTCLCDMINQLQSQMNRMEESRTQRDIPILPDPPNAYHPPSMAPMFLGDNQSKGDTVRNFTPNVRQGEERNTTSLRPNLIPRSLPVFERNKNREDGSNKYAGETRLGKLDFPRFNGKEVQETQNKKERGKLNERDERKDE